MRKLTCKKSPFTDKNDKEAWEGNEISHGGFVFFTKTLLFERGTWWLYDNSPFYIDQSKRYERATQSLFDKLYIIDDRAALK